MVQGSTDEDYSVSDGSPGIAVKFWGVRGHIPTPGPATAQYGGNTPCVELCVGGKRLIFDGGTGLRPLGEYLDKCCGEAPIEAYLFFTQTQTDRIQGFPFFRPAFQGGNCFHVHGPQSTNGASIKHALAEQMLRPKSQVPFHEMKASLNFDTVSPGQRLLLGDITIDTVALNNSNSALGYRVSWNDYTIVYATDSHGATTSDGLQRLARDADLLIFDAAQTHDSYFNPEAGDYLRSLSTWKQSIGATLDVGAKTIVMFYHSPDHEDEFLDKVESEMKAIYPNVLMAREGHLLTLGQRLG